MGRISGKSLKALSASKTPGQMFLCLRQGAGCPPARSWATVILSPGASSTPRRVGASHKDGNVYLLSSILMEDVPDRYSLSPKACQGILRRAAKRGKELPEVDVYKRQVDPAQCFADLNFTSRGVGGLELVEPPAVLFMLP